MNLIVVCTIVTSSLFMDIHTDMYRASSLQVCHRYSNEHGGHGMVAYAKIYDLSHPDDVKDYTAQCGVDGKDCKSAD